MAKIARSVSVAGKFKDNPQFRAVRSEGLAFERPLVTVHLVDERAADPVGRSVETTFCAQQTRLAWTAPGNIERDRAGQDIA